MTLRLQRDLTQADATEDGARNVNERQKVRQAPNDRSLPGTAFFCERGL
jgi:hypothetical protein